jgi:hypothetical protein
MSGLSLPSFVNIILSANDYRNKNGWFHPVVVSELVAGMVCMARQER